MKVIRYVDAAIASVLMLIFALCVSQPANAAESTLSSEEVSIMRTVHAYQDAIDRSDVDATMRVYTLDGVIMPPGRPSVIGAADIRKMYTAGFKANALNIVFQVAEVVRMGPDWAFVRTSSSGVITMRANGATKPELNKELFILKQSPDGTWKIARYSFSESAAR
jgi:uncharacterized protein (TIGR02246 family)